ncbi:hypothetical protein [Thalassospira alkalitolerans]|uniref:hypothetical protein n=1 Tax=Thalassospira alkalitolerans TaxID=1293890 RepID=UPI0030EEEBB3
MGAKLRSQSGKVCNIILLMVLLSVVMIRVWGPATNIQPDSPRYVSAGLNLAEYGVLSGRGFRADHAPSSDFIQGGIYTAAEIALASMISTTTREGLMCIAESPSGSGCDLRLPALKIIYTLEVFLFHIAVWFVGFLFFQNKLGAWLAVGFSMLFRETYIYNSSILTEPSYLMISGGFVVSWMFALKKAESVSRWFLSGVMLGLLVLVKPAWSALAVCLGSCALVIFLIKRDKRLWILRSFGGGACGYCLFIVPILLWNGLVLQVWSLSSPDYLTASLSHRLAFNLMSWKEWAIGWVYYLPVSGAGRLFGVNALLPLGWDTGSYYEYGRDVLNAIAVQGRTASEANRYLLENFVLKMPIKEIAVTALLLWRGIFVGLVIGMLAVPMTAIYLMCARGKDLTMFLAVLLPCLFMAVVHAMVSVSIYRYNLPLIIPYVLVMAYFTLRIIDRIMLLNFPAFSVLRTNFSHRQGK